MLNFDVVMTPTMSSELIKVPEVCFPGEEPPPMSNAPKNSLFQIGLKFGCNFFDFGIKLCLMVSL